MVFSGVFCKWEFRDKNGVFFLLAWVFQTLTVSAENCFVMFENSLFLYIYRIYFQENVNNLQASTDDKAGQI